jgi:2-polyprenyl-6-hydroxyphenyl methylase / 3-demethylubiquinone-9 3-methyltransferase
VTSVPTRPRNDPGLYEDLSGEWWNRAGPFAALHWLARARAGLLPRAATGEVLLDIGCGGGLMAPYVEAYLHIGVDLSQSALRVAADHGVRPLLADARALPVPDGIATVVVAGELFEHVQELDAVLAEIARVLRPGGVLIFDTINDTLWARLSLVLLGERLPGGPPPGIHDPSLFVSPHRLIRLLARHGIRARVRGLRPSFIDYLGFLLTRSGPVRMIPTRSLGSLYQGRGSKER